MAESPCRDGSDYRYDSDSSREITPSPTPVPTQAQPDMVPASAIMALTSTIESLREEIRGMKISYDNLLQENSELRKQMAASNEQHRRDFLVLISQQPQTVPPPIQPETDRAPTQLQPAQTTEIHPQNNQSTEIHPQAHQSTDMQPQVDQPMDAEEWTTVQPRKKRRAPTTSSSSSDEEKSPRKPTKKPAIQRESDPGSSKDQPPEESNQVQSSTKRPPPIFIHKEGQWMAVRNQLPTATIKLTSTGMRLQLSSVDDYRKARSILEQQNIEMHSYTLDEDKNLHVVMRGIPKIITDSQITKDLEDQGFKPSAVRRMTSKHTRKQIPLVKIEVPKSEKHIYDVKVCCLVRITMEPMKKRTGPNQCYRCQIYGHCQNNCTATPRCVRCGGHHRAAECKLPREQPAKCANCRGQHPANFRGCPRCPKPSQQAPAPRVLPTTRITPGTSYAKASSPPPATQAPVTQAPTAPAEDIADVIKSILRQQQQQQEQTNALIAKLFNQIQAQK
nr:unnamed protein product [Callosobruchus chinensis]CAH7726146.1 unnamed protein product [Callosobruchus chinensis]